MLEKPPTGTVSELVNLARIADNEQRVLFTTWHSQYNDAVVRAKEHLQGRKVKHLNINWKEDVRHWHPGQQWIWQAGGFGVFDPGINALSIVTEIMPEPIYVTDADLFFPENRDTPIAAHLKLATGHSDNGYTAEFDWRQIGPQSWDIEIRTEDGDAIRLSKGGTRLEIDGALVAEAEPQEYERIYDRFDTLLRTGESLVHMAQFQLVADAFLLGRRVVVEPFND